MIWLIVRFYIVCFVSNIPIPFIPISIIKRKYEQKIELHFLNPVVQSLIVTSHIIPTATAAVSSTTHAATAANIYQYARHYDATI